MAEDALYSRHVEQHLIEALEDSPVVLIHGARQCGKTTLARMVGTPRDYAYINFDDNIVRDAAQMDPAGFVANLPELRPVYDVDFTVRRWDSKHRNFGNIERNMGHPAAYNKSIHLP